MTTLADNSKTSAAALLREARAVNKTAKAYGSLNRGGTAAPISQKDVSRDIVLAFLGGGKV